MVILRQRMRAKHDKIATAVYEDGAALERQESAAQVHRAMAMFADALEAPPERTIFDASIDPTLVYCKSDAHLGPTAGPP